MNGYPLSGKKTQCHLIKEKYKGIKIYNPEVILRRKMKEYFEYKAAKEEAEDNNPDHKPKTKANFEYDSFKRENPKLAVTNTDKLQKELDLLGRLIAYTESYLHDVDKGRVVTQETSDVRRKFYLLKSQMLEKYTFASKATMLNKPIEQFNFSTLALWVSGLK